MWDANGRIEDRAAAWPLLKAVAEQLSGTDEGTLMQAADVVSLARDVAQGAVMDGSAAPDAHRFIADAEQRLWSGDAAGAVDLLGQVANV